LMPSIWIWIFVSAFYGRRHDYRPNDTQHNNIQRNNTQLK
jgi:hypothetical protein